MGLLRLMGNKADVVKGLAKRCNENWRVAPTSDIVCSVYLQISLFLRNYFQGLYLSDIQDHLITMTQSLNHYEKILSRSHSNYLAQISIEMTDANNQINDVLSKLTALGTVLIPMNLVTGLWGMNVHVPGQDVPVSTEGFIEKAPPHRIHSGIRVVLRDHRLPCSHCCDRWLVHIQTDDPVTVNNTHCLMYLYLFMDRTTLSSRVLSARVEIRPSHTLYHPIVVTLLSPLGSVIYSLKVFFHPKLHPR